MALNVNVYKDIMILMIFVLFVQQLKIHYYLVVIKIVIPNRYGFILHVLIVQQNVIYVILVQ